MENLQIRTEHSRSIEDADRLRAIETLTQLGVLIPVSELETYHGRVSLPDEEGEWTVDPSFTNGSNDSGNYNVNARPTLYTSDKETAEAFASSRKLEKSLLLDTEKLRAEAHEIASADSDATVIDFSFDVTKLDENDMIQYHNALRSLLIAMTEGSPVRFEDRTKVRSFVDVLKAHNSGIIADEDIGKLADEANVDKRLAVQLASAYNAMQLTRSSLPYLTHQLIANSADIFQETFPIGNGQEEVSINLEYVKRYLHNSHIVGAKQDIISSTLERKVVSVSFFDLDKVNTVTELQQSRDIVSQRLGGLATELIRISEADTHDSKSILNLLSNPYVKPETLVEAATKLKGYKDIFEADAGNWEGYTLAEHTETVLRNFDENYADVLPVELLGPMRLAMLIHDIGKPQAYAEGMKHLQKRYNVEQADKFLVDLGVKDNVKGLLLDIIGEGSELAFLADVRKEDLAEVNLANFARSSLEKFNDGEATDEQVSSFVEMCKILQICDGGAYTSMAITRSSAGGRYRNAPAFNRSFAQPFDLGRRALKLRKASEASAKKDLTP